MTESELTDQEKQLVVKELPQFAEETDDTYYLIYRPTRQLPATGHSQLISSIAAGAGIVLLVVAIKLGRDDRKKLASFMLFDQSRKSANCANFLGFDKSNAR